MFTKILGVILALALSSPAWAGEVYSWEDKDGMHFVDDPSKIPAKHQSKTKRRDEYGTSQKIHPRVIDGRLDVDDLQRQIRYLNDRDKRECNKEVDEAKERVAKKFLSENHEQIITNKMEQVRSDCSRNIRKNNMEYYRGIISIYRQGLSVEEHRFAINWQL